MKTKKRKPKVEPHHYDLAYRLYLAIEPSVPTQKEFDKWAAAFAELEQSMFLCMKGGDPWKHITDVLSWYDSAPWNELLSTLGVRDAKTFCENFAALDRAYGVLYCNWPDRLPDDPDDDPGEEVDDADDESELSVIRSVRLDRKAV